MVEAWQTQSGEAVSLQTTLERTRNNLHFIPHTSFSTNRRSRMPDPIRFAHPAEASIAALLDSHNVCWQYEPTTFPLVAAEDGTPLQSFTPDFYLPVYDVYIEMTTMRQSLVTRKNRKFRLLREIYPELNVRLLYRKDVELIVDRYGHGAASLVDTAGQIVASEESIRRNLAELAEDFSGCRKITLVALGSGSLPVTRLLANEIRVKQAANVIVASLAIAGQRGSRSSNDFGLSETIRSGNHVVLIADVIGTGLTVASAIEWLSARDVIVEQVVALADRTSARLVNLPPVRSMVNAPSAWLVGMGLGNCASLTRLTDLHQVAARSDR